MKPEDSEARAQVSLEEPEVEDTGSIARSHMHTPNRPTVKQA